MDDPDGQGHHPRVDGLRPAANGGERFAQTDQSEACEALLLT